MDDSEKQQRPSPDAVGGKAARACYGCLRHRARWYCTAHHAFLCQICDSSVHSANSLVRRHQRVRLTTTSLVGEPGESSPSWLEGFERKARTSRPQHRTNMMAAGDLPEQLVDASVDEDDDGEQEEELSYCVPIRNPLFASFCSPPPALDNSNATSSGDDAAAKTSVELSDNTPASPSTINKMDGFLAMDLEISEFAARIKSLLGGDLVGGDDTFCMANLELAEPVAENTGFSIEDDARHVKMEQPDRDEDESQGELELNLECSFPFTRGEEESEEDEVAGTAVKVEQGAEKKAKLRLDYESIIMAWSSQGSSPWTDGERPQINVDNCWPDYMDMWTGRRMETERACHGGEIGVYLGDGKREARVTRYREKRRTRLFSKKIRYEVRKLNAEKRPRMKGRFVKRTPALACGHG
ncbi:zinc finger protein CONSTANS-LIKE 6-like isoform X1 [Musa acuminata AAA Group]|uniref:zinc finger protein CONSTANS-LIKE 6-like isoform X1 n=1 Tax=Musa acuminata AAA Group TaxID=214697 RepID=UPI0031D3C531